VEKYQDLPNFHKLTPGGSITLGGHPTDFTWTSIPLQLVEAVFYPRFPQWYTASKKNMPWSLYLLIMYTMTGYTTSTTWASQRVGEHIFTFSPPLSHLTRDGRPYVLWHRTCKAFRNCIW